MRILELFEFEEWCFLFSILISLDIIQGPPLFACSNLLVYRIYLHFYNWRTLKSSVFDDFPVLSNNGRLSRQFHVGRSRLIEMVAFLSFFFNFLRKQLLKFVLPIS